jgi:topoisomerase-4 subunit A
MATSIPPHNAAELIAAAVALIDNPQADVLDHVRGPDFPTGGKVVDSAAAIRESYATGRGSFRVRAKIEKVVEKGGGWHLIVSEMPYGVQKGKLIEAIAELINEKKLPILGDVRDESADDVRIVLEPRSRTVDADTLMESMFRLSDLEDPRAAQPQRARRAPHPAGDEPARGAVAMARAPVRRAASQVRAPAE